MNEISGVFSAIHEPDPKTILGARVGAERRRQGKTLKTVSSATGLAISTLSRIENGVLSVTYDNMALLAAALNLDVVDLLEHPPTTAPTARRSIIRAGQGDIHETDVYRYEMLHTDLSKRKIIPIRATVKSHSIAKFGPLKRHKGEEFFLVLSGQVELHAEHYSPIILAPGDSAYFDSTMGHALLASGADNAEIIWVASET